MITASMLTPGERLVVYRLRNELTQSQMAEKLGISPTALSNYERGTHDMPPKANLAPLKFNLGEIYECESIRAMRRRANLTAQEVANAIGVCRYTVRLMESGESDPSRAIDFLEELLGY